MDIYGAPIFKIFYLIPTYEQNVTLLSWEGIILTILWRYTYCSELNRIDTYVRILLEGYTNAP